MGFFEEASQDEQRAMMYTLERGLPRAPLFPISPFGTWVSAGRQAIHSFASDGIATRGARNPIRPCMDLRNPFASTEVVSSGYDLILCNSGPRRL